MKDSGDNDPRPVVDKWLDHLAVMGSVYFIGLTEVAMGKKLDGQL